MKLPATNNFVIPSKAQTFMDNVSSFFSCFFYWAGVRGPQQILCVRLAMARTYVSHIVSYMALFLLLTLKYARWGIFVHSLSLVLFPFGTYLYHAKFLLRSFRCLLEKIISMEICIYVCTASLRLLKYAH